MKTAQYILTIQTAAPLSVSPDRIAAAVLAILPDGSRVNAVRSRMRETLVKYADPATMHRLEPDARETWTAHGQRISAEARALRTSGSPVRVVKITADGYLKWLADRPDTTAARRDYADWIADHRTRTITEARRTASRENGKHGGRPRKTS